MINETPVMAYNILTKEQTPFISLAEAARKLNLCEKNIYRAANLGKKAGRSVVAKTYKFKLI